VLNRFFNCRSLVVIRPLQSMDRAEQIEWRSRVGYSPETMFGACSDLGSRQAGHEAKNDRGSSDRSNNSRWGAHQVVRCWSTIARSRTRAFAAMQSHCAARRNEARLRQLPSVYHSLIRPRFAEPI